MPRRSERGIGEVAGNEVSQRLDVMTDVGNSCSRRLYASGRLTQPSDSMGTKALLTCLADIACAYDASIG
jgi:hypothetical protein